VVELVRLGPGSSWDTYWPQWTPAMSIQFHHVNKVERKTAKKKKCVGIANSTVVVASLSFMVSPLFPTAILLLAL